MLAQKARSIWSLSKTFLEWTCINFASVFGERYVFDLLLGSPTQELLLFGTATQNRRFFEHEVGLYQSHLLFTRQDCKLQTGRTTAGSDAWVLGKGVSSAVATTALGGEVLTLPVCSSFLKSPSWGVREDLWCQMISIWLFLFTVRVKGALKINLFLFSTFLTLSFVLHTTNKEKVLGKHKGFQSNYYTIVFYFIYKTHSVHCLLVLFPDLVHKLLCLVLYFLPVCLQFFACSYEKECWDSKLGTKFCDLNENQIN